MILRNTTRRTVLTKELIPAFHLKKIQGLMGARHPQALLLKTNLGIHTFFLKFPIDIIILDKNHTVVMLENSLKPWKIFVWNPKYGTVIELPEGTIEKSKTEIHDRLAIQ